MKNEEPYVDEFIIYHLYGCKFDKIYIYDNSDKGTLMKYNGSHGGRVSVKHFPGRYRQNASYQDFLKEQKSRSPEKRDKWCAIIDTDEFVVLKKHQDIHDFLKEYCKEGGVLMNWYIFGSSGRKEYSPEPVTKRFLKRMGPVGPNENDPQWNVKSIFVIDDVDEITNFHSVGKFKPGKFLKDTNGKPIEGGLHPNGPTDVIVLHHYHTKSEGEYREKISRGKADNNSKRSMAEFHGHDKNDNFDDSADKIYDKALAEYQKTGAMGGGGRRRRSTRKRLTRRRARK